MAENVLKGTISVTAPGVKETFAQVATGAKQAETGLKDLGTGVAKTQAVVRTLPPAIVETSLSLKDQRSILAALQKQYAALSTQQAKSRIGLELAADIKIANNEIKRLEAGAVSSFGNVGKAATKGFSAFRQLAFILPGLGIAGIFNLAFTAIEKVVGSLFNLNSGFSDADIAAARFKQALDEISKSAENLKAQLDFQDDISRLKAQLSGLEGSQLNIIDLTNRTESNIKLITSEEAVTRSLEKQKNQVKQLAEAYIESGLASTKFKQLAFAASQGQVIPKTFISELAKNEKEVATTYIDILKEIEDSQKRSSTAQSAIGKDFLQIQIDQAQAQKDLLKKRLSDSERFINETISQGKRLAAFFEGRRVVPFFSQFDTKPEQFEKAKQLIEDFNAGSLKIIFRPPVDVQPEFKFETGFIKKQFVPRFRNFLTEFQSTLDGFSKLELKLNLKVKLSATVIAAQEAQAEVVEDFEKFVKNINKTLQGIQADALANVGEAIGAALSGGDLKNVFADFANIIGDGLQAIGKQMIKIGAVAVLAKKALAKLFANPVLAIIAGIALVAAGAALKNLLGGGLRGFAKGGRPPVGTDVLVGEKGPEIFRADRPGTIIPNHKIASEMASVVTTDRSSVKDISHTISKIVTTVLDKVAQFQSTTLDKVAEFHSNVSSSFEKIIGYSRVERSRDASTSSKEYTVNLSKDVSRLFENVSTDSSRSSISTKDISKILSEALVYSHSSSAQKESVSKYNVSDVAKILSTVFTSTSTHERDSSKVNTFDKVIHSAFQYSTSATDKLIDRLATYTDKSSKSSDSKVFQSLISSTDKSVKEFSQILSTYTTASRSSELFSDVSRSVKELHSLFTNYSDSKLQSTAVESRLLDSRFVSDKLLTTYSDLAAYYSDSKLVSTQTTATFKSILSTLREFSDIVSSVIKTTSAVNTTSVATATNTTKEATATNTRESSHKSTTDHKTSIREFIVSFIDSSKQIFHSVNSTIERLLSTVIKTQPVVVQYGNHITNITKAASTLNNLTRNVQFRAAGGPVSRNATTIVGEKGPELFTPKVSGYIIPHHKVNSYLKNLYKTSITEKEINLFRSTRNVKDLNLSKIFNRRISNFSQLTHKELLTIIGKQFAGFRAGGGFVGAGNSIVVGERKLELFVPNTGASITNNNNTGGAGRVSGGTLKVEGNIRIAGSDLIAVIANASRSQSRLS